MTDRHNVRLRTTPGELYETKRKVCEDSRYVRKTENVRDSSSFAWSMSTKLVGAYVRPFDTMPAYFRQNRASHSCVVTITCNTSDACTMALAEILQEINNR
jgi:hypothetical protein